MSLCLLGLQQQTNIKQGLMCEALIVGWQLAMCFWWLGFSYVGGSPARYCLHLPRSRICQGYDPVTGDRPGQGLAGVTPCTLSVSPLPLQVGAVDVYLEILHQAWRVCRLLTNCEGVLTS